MCTIFFKVSMCLNEELTDAMYSTDVVTIALKPNNPLILVKKWFYSFFQIALLGVVKGELDKKCKHEFKGTDDFRDAKINL